MQWYQPHSTAHTMHLTMSMDKIIWTIVLIILFGPLVYVSCVYIISKNKYLAILTDIKKFAHIIKFTPWIYRQIEASTNSVLSRYQFDVTSGSGSRKISKDEYNEIINTIRTHFYGSVPSGITKDMMFNYIDPNQIDILILNEFNKMNGGFLVINRDDVT